MVTRHEAMGSANPCSPYDIPYQAFINYMNAIQDLKEKAKRAVRR